MRAVLHARARVRRGRAPRGEQLGRERAGGVALAGPGRAVQQVGVRGRPVAAPRRARRRRAGGRRGRRALLAPIDRRLGDVGVTSESSAVLITVEGLDGAGQDDARRPGSRARCRERGRECSCCASPAASSCPSASARWSRTRRWRRPARRGAAVRGRARAARGRAAAAAARRRADRRCSTASSTPRSPTRAPGAGSASRRSARSTRSAPAACARPHAAAAHRPGRRARARRRPRRGADRLEREHEAFFAASRAAYDALAAAEPERWSRDRRARSRRSAVLARRARLSSRRCWSRSRPGGPGARPTRRRSSSRGRARAPSRARARIFSLAATSAAGSPGRRGSSSTADLAAGHARARPRSPRARSSRCRCRGCRSGACPGSIASSASRCARPRSSTWM